MLSVMRSCGMVVFLAGLSACQPAFKADPKLPPVNLPFGVLHPARNAAYLQNEKEGITAVDLGSGRLLWEFDDPSNPLLVHNDRLYAWYPHGANALQIIALDCGQEGKLVLKSEPIHFPAWVSVVMDYGKSFELETLVHEKNIFIKWTASYVPSMGPYRRKEAQAAKQTASGWIKIDPDSRSVEQVDPPKLPASPDIKLPPGIDESQQNEYQIFEYDWAPVSVRKPITVGDTLVALNGGKLKRWDLKSFKELGSTDFPEQNMPPALTWGGRHLIFPTEGNKVLSLATGDWVGYIPDKNEGGIRLGYAVIGSRCYYRLRKSVAGSTIPRVFKSIDLRNDELIWERPIAPERHLKPRS